MRGRERLLFVAAAVLVFLAGCRRDEPVDVLPEPPASYQALVGAWREGRGYLDTRTLASFSKVFFSDGSSIVVPKEEWTIEDCTETVPRTVRYDAGSGRWILDGTDTGLERVNGNFEKAFPVYAWHDLRYLKVFASNGDTLSFDNGWEPEADPENPDPSVEPGEKNHFDEYLHNKEIPASYAIPEVYIFTEGGKPIDSKQNYVNATFRFRDPSKFWSDTYELEVTGKIRGRGNTTWGMPKKPYRVKLDEKTKVFGLYGNRDWILLANYSDKSLLRNITMMEVSRIAGMSWTPRMLSVNVYLNNQYVGVYAFCDHKEIAGHRVNIEVVTPQDNAGEALTGGYYLELEEAMDEPVCFKTVWDTPVMFHEPEYPTEAQQRYVKDWFNGFEDALSRVQGGDYESWRKYIDRDSFVNYYIIQEIAKNPDGNVRKSTYLTKERNKPLEMYHVWDFDITLGNCNYTNFEKPDGWQMRYVKWYNQLFFDPEFKQAVVDRWKELYPSLREVPAFIDRQHRMMDGAEDANFRTWDILGKYVWPNFYYFGTYQEEYGFLVSYYNDRLDWLNGMITSEQF